MCALAPPYLPSWAVNPVHLSSQARHGRPWNIMYQTLPLNSVYTSSNLSPFMSSKPCTPILTGQTLPSLVYIMYQTLPLNSVYTSSNLPPFMSCKPCTPILTGQTWPSFVYIMYQTLHLNSVYTSSNLPPFMSSEPCTPVLTGQTRPSLIYLLNQTLLKVENDKYVQSRSFFSACFELKLNAGKELVSSNLLHEKRNNEQWLLKREQAVNKGVNLQWTQPWCVRPLIGLPTFMYTIETYIKY